MVKMFERIIVSKLNFVSLITELEKRHYDSHKFWLLSYNFDVGCLTAAFLLLHYGMRNGIDCDFAV